MIFGMWIMAGLAIGLVAVELVPGDRRNPVKWLCGLTLGLAGSFAGGGLGYWLESGGKSELPVLSILFSLLGACALLGAASWLKHQYEQRGVLKG